MEILLLLFAIALGIAVIGAAVYHGTRRGEDCRGYPYNCPVGRHAAECIIEIGRKKDVQKAGKTVKQQIESTAPKKTGKYSKSWAVKKTRETSDSIQIVVHSKRYQLTHLLEFGHAKRGGGRTRAFPHIAPAEQAGIEQLTRDIERDLQKGG